MRWPFYAFEENDIVVPKIRAPNIDCAALFKNVKSEQEKAMAIMKQKYKGTRIFDANFTTLKCKEFVQHRGYITSEGNREERNFPIAFSIAIFKDLGQVERLLRSIYRPQNAYCFHMDSKSPKLLHRGIHRLASCFPNVIVAKNSVDVRWGNWSVLEADLICMKELLDRFPDWKYLINLTGQEFPLRTNLELVRILKAFNGSNSMEGTVARLNPGRAPKTNPGNVSILQFMTRLLSVVTGDVFSGVCVRGGVILCSDNGSNLPMTHF